MHRSGTLYEAVAASARLEDMGPRGHYLLKDAPAWNEVALRSCLDLLPS